MGTGETEHEAIRRAAATSKNFLVADDLEVSSSAMARMENEGAVIRVVPGIYLGSTQSVHPLAEAAAWVRRHPHAVACLLTAAVHHDLTDAFARGNWLYVAKGMTRPRSRVAPLHVVQTAPQFIDPEHDEANGIATFHVHGVALRITDPDRTTIDLWRYPRSIPKEHALQALRRRTRAKRFHLPTFARLARRLSAWKRLEPTVQGMTIQ